MAYANASRRLHMDCTTVTENSVSIGLTIDHLGRGTPNYSLPGIGRASGPTDEAAAW